MSLWTWVHALDKWSRSGGNRVVHFLLEFRCGDQIDWGEADEFQSQASEMKRQLQIRFEMDTPVLRGFAVTNGLVPRWNMA